MKIVVKNVNKTYETSAEKLHILKNIDFSMKSGEWLTIVGPSGSGKSTLLQCIAGINRPDPGSEIVLDDFHIMKSPEEDMLTFRRNNIGFIYQDYRLFEQFDALLNVILPLVPYENKRNLLQKGEELLHLVGLSERMHHMPSQVSGGEKQRVAIARALLNDPSLIICDEPTGNLDEPNRNQIMELLQKLNEKGKSIILVTHDHDILSYGQKTVLLKHGKLANFPAEKQSVKL
ncbi:ABC transporter ATP-binding protein [Evansella halocellulosilytica]|uniref:ABC transporter ATP-binding protein n=1 Tax=Evansella halocellulosilytica TaxID=2011013 RepID=UPI000BB6E58C|nr:ABC transporter ATP-binding protein [Evansella halocellulosilytica]